MLTTDEKKTLKERIKSLEQSGLTETPELQISRQTLLKSQMNQHEIEDSLNDVMQSLAFAESICLEMKADLDADQLRSMIKDAH
jgi:hypothetical protein